MSWVMEKVKRVDGDGDRGIDNTNDVHKVYSTIARKHDEKLRDLLIQIN
jgi:hypothetical protein